MLRLVCFAFILVVIVNILTAKKLGQSGAVVSYCNPEYIVNCTAITKRTRRGEPYKTNITGVTLQSWSNNVTIKISFNPNKYADMMMIQGKICDMGKLKWFKEYTMTYSNIPSVCPIPANYYYFNNLEFPPKNFPLPIPAGDFEMRTSFELTDTKVEFGACSIFLDN